MRCRQALDLPQFARLPGTSLPSIAIPCSSTWRATVRLTLTSCVWPACRIRANMELNPGLPRSASRMAPRPAGTTSKIKSSNCPCRSLRSRIACTIRLILSSAFRLRATCESRRQLTQQPVRLQIDHIPGMDDGGRRGDSCILEFHPAPARLQRPLLRRGIRKKSRRWRSRLRVAATALRPPCRSPAFRCGCRGPDPKLPVLPTHQAMFSRDRRIDNRDPIRPFPSDGDFALGRGIVESFKGPESTRSLGRKLLTSRFFLSQFGAQIHSRSEAVPISEQIGQLSDRIATGADRRQQPRRVAGASSAT